MFRVRQLCYCAGKKPLLADVTFSLEAGSTLAVIGPNGAGKSTLLKCLCRILPAAPGTLEIQGRPAEAYAHKALARLISYVPQAVERDDLFSVQDFVLQGRYPHLSPFATVSRRDQEAVARALAWTGLESLARRRIVTLSAGEQQKVLIAAALAQEARLMLLDEPAAYLDPYQQEQIYALLERLRRETGITLIEVTHDVNRAASGHGRILALRAGRMVFDGSPSELMTSGVLQAIYGKTFTLTRHPATGCAVALP